jgi:hypothetical protein
MNVVIVLLNNREALEHVENSIFDSVDDMLDALRQNGMTDEEEDELGYYGISDFMDLVNDQVLDNLEGTFFGYVTIQKKI